MALVLIKNSDVFFVPMLMMYDHFPLVKKKLFKISLKLWRLLLQGLEGVLHDLGFS